MKLPELSSPGQLWIPPACRNSKWDEKGWYGINCIDFTCQGSRKREEIQIECTALTLCCHSDDLTSPGGRCKCCCPDAVLFYIEAAVISSQQQRTKYISAWHAKLFTVCFIAKCKYWDLFFFNISFISQVCFSGRDVYLAVFKSLFASVNKNDQVIILASYCTVDKLLRPSLKSQLSLLLTSHSLYDREIS